MTLVKHKNLASLQRVIYSSHLINGPISNLAGWLRPSNVNKDSAVKGEEEEKEEEDHFVIHKRVCVYKARRKANHLCCGL